MPDPVQAPVLVGIEGSSASELAAAIAFEDASRRTWLLVVGSRGRGGFTGMLVGSVSDTVARLTRMPVIVARESHA